MHSSLSISLLQLYVGDGTLLSNTTYKVVIYNLGVPSMGNSVSTVAFINDRPTLVEFLTPVSQESALDISQLEGELFIGGYRDVGDLRVSGNKNVLNVLAAF